jgi:myo-inositol-1-phosphate synthase
MTGHRVGLWLVGAFGGVGTAITVGLAAMRRGMANRTGLVTELPVFAGLPLPDPGDLVIGGHDIRATSFDESAEEFRVASGVFEAGWLSACKDDLAAASARVRPGSHFGAGKAISKLANWATARPNQSARQAIDRIAADLAAFAKAESLQHVIVLNVASTEPPFELSDVHHRWDSLSPALAAGGPELLPASAELGRIGSRHPRPGPIHRLAPRRQGRQDR